MTGDRPEGLAEWIVVGAEVGVTSGRDSIAVHTVDRIGKRDVVLSNGLRMRPYGGSGDIDLVHRTQGAWTSDDYGYPVDSDTFRRVDRRHREKDAMTAVESRLRQRSRQMSPEPAVHAGATAAEIDDPAVRRDLLRALRMQRGKSVGAFDETWALLKAAL